MFEFGLKIEQENKTVTVENTKFVEKLKKYLEDDRFQKIYAVSGSKEINQGRRNFRLRNFYNTEVILTLDENPRHKIVQFYFSKRKVAMETLRKDLDGSLFWEKIDAALVKYSEEKPLLLTI